METVEKSNRNCGISEDIQYSPENNFEVEGYASIMSVHKNRQDVGRQKDTFANPKKITRIETQNVRAIYAIGKTAQVIVEMKTTQIFLTLVNADGQGR